MSYCSSTSSSLSDLSTQHNREHQKQQQSLLDIKVKQLAQAKQKRRILEETLSGTKAEEEMLQHKLKSLQLQRDKLDHDLFKKKTQEEIYGSFEFQQWWSDGVIGSIQRANTETRELLSKLMLLRSSSERAHEEENESQVEETSNAFQKVSESLKMLSHLHQSHKLLFAHPVQRKKSSPALANSSFSSTSAQSSSKYSSLLLREAACFLAEVQALESSANQTQSGPLSQLEVRHKQLEGAIAEAKRKTHALNMEAEKRERLILIERYRSEIPLLRQELATRPKASDVAEFKQRMADQIPMLSSELNSVMGELQLFERRGEMEEEFENALAKGEALRVEVASLQEQLAGLVDFSVEQKEKIRQWQETELPRHEDFLGRLEDERDQLKRELGLEVDDAAGGGGEGGGDEGVDVDDDDGDELGNTRMGSPGSAERGRGRGADGPFLGASLHSPQRIVEVVHFDGSRTEIETKKAPRRWQRSAKFRLHEAQQSQDRHSSPSVSSHSATNVTNGAAASLSSLSSSNGKSNSLMSQTFRILSDMYVPPMVEFTSSIDASGHRKDDRIEAASLTVRVLSKLSSWIFGESSWVERGRKEKKKVSTQVVV